MSDYLGSVVAVVNVATGEIEQEMEYDSWGRVLSDTKQGFQPFGFAGGLYDAQTGLVRFGARDYDAELGRWTSKDPAGHAAGGANLFVYALNSPVGLVDLNGRWPTVPCSPDHTQPPVPSQNRSSEARWRRACR